MEYSPKKTKEILEKENIVLKKKFGQNFIVDENIIDMIIKKANIDKDTLVLEVGPGAGALTYKLAQNAKNVLCYEIDTTLKPLLENNLKEFTNVNIIYSDFLKENVTLEIEKYDFKKLYVVANLPYYITTPILVKIIEDQLPLDKIIIMVQKEVGDRFRAKPNSKDYNSLSVYLNYYFDIKKVLDISRNVFIPKPNVDSIVIEFTKKKRPYLKDEKTFFKLVRDSFKQKRKNLRNNLQGYDLNKIAEILKKYNFDLTVRAEQLDLDIFIDIANNL